MAILRTILYVEDEPDIQSIAKMALEALGGWEVHLCDNGEQALERAESIQPDLILLDVMMPCMDGPTTLRALQERGGRLASIPVVFMTAKAQAHEVKQYQDLGALDVISKPFDPMKLPEQIRQIWQQAQEG